MSEALAWAAGFFDGEGSTSLTKAGRIMVTIGQTDPEVLHRFREAVGLGAVSGPYPYSTRVNKEHRAIWGYRAYGADAIEVIDRLWPWLGTAKRSQAGVARLSAHIVPKGFCRKGLHDLRAEGSRRPDGRCRECDNATKRAYRAAQDYSPNEDLEWVPEFLKV